MAFLPEPHNVLRDELHPLGTAEAFFASDMPMGLSEAESRPQGATSNSLSDACQIFMVLLILQLGSMIDILKHPWLIGLNLILLLVRQ